MGCGTPREKLEDEMMVYKLERLEVQMEKEKELKKLAEIEGHTIERNQIPDYIDPQFAKKKRMNYISNIVNKNDYNNEKVNKLKEKKNNKISEEKQSINKKKAKKKKQENLLYKIIVVFQSNYKLYLVL